MSTAGSPSTRVMRLVLKGYWYVLSVFLGAGAMAVIAHWADTVMQFMPGDWPTRAAQHAGWVVGAILFSIGIPLGWVHVTVGTSRVEDTPVSEPEPAPEVPQDLSWGRTLKVGLVGGLAGLVLGFLVGATLVVIWFSIALSPWGPMAWAEAVAVGPTGVATSHPLVGSLWAGATGGLGLLGFVAGLTGAKSGKATATWQGRTL